MVDRGEAAHRNPRTSVRWLSGQQRAAQQSWYGALPETAENGFQEQAYRAADRPFEYAVVADVVQGFGRSPGICEREECTPDFLRPHPSGHARGSKWNRL